MLFEKLALTKVDSKTFCGGNQWQVCQLSPHCEVVVDPEGLQLLKNMGEIARSGLFQRKRMKSAFENATNVNSLYKHPAMWGPLEDCSFVSQFIALGDRNSLTLDTLIQTVGPDGKRNWAIEKAIIKNIRGDYKDDFFGDMFRYARNKIAHVKECDEDIDNYKALYPRRHSQDTLCASLE